MSDFYFALARITAAQICRACGIDRCSRGVLEILTDVLIKYLMLLGSASATALELRNACDATAADALLAAAQYDAIRAPGPDGIDDIVDLMRWLKGPMQQRMTRVARPQKQGASLLGAAQGAALAALPSSAAAAAAAENGHSSSGKAAQNRPPPSDGSRVSSGARTPAAASGRIETVTPGGGSAGAATAPAVAPGPSGQSAASASDGPTDWLTAVLNQQMLMGHRNKFKNTPLGPSAEIDPTIWGDPRHEASGN